MLTLQIFLPLLLLLASLQLLVCMRAAFIHILFSTFVFLCLLLTGPSDDNLSIIAGLDGRDL